VDIKYKTFTDKNKFTGASMGACGETWAIRNRGSLLTYHIRQHIMRTNFSMMYDGAAENRNIEKNIMHHFHSAIQSRLVVAVNGTFG